VGKTQLRLWEILLGVVVIALPLAFWSAELHGIKKTDDIKYINKIKAINISGSLITFTFGFIYFKYVLYVRPKQRDRAK
jgi:hypothetical protein